MAVPECTGHFVRACIPVTQCSTYPIRAVFSPIYLENRAQKFDCLSTGTQEEVLFRGVMFPANEVKAIFYDLDGTLHAENPPQLEVFSKHSNELGLEVTVEARLNAARWEHYYFSQSEEILADRANFPDYQQFWENFVHRQCLALGASPEQAAELGPHLYQYMTENYHPADALLPGVRSVLNTLRKRGYILGVVTNQDQLRDAHPREFGLRRYFDFWLSADQVNSWKPDKRIFEYALQLAHVEARQTIFVGDNYFTDVIGSRQAGMKPVLLDIYGVFDEPGCPVIRSHHEILDLLD